MVARPATHSPEPRMDVHENARSTRHSRMLMIGRLQAGWTVAGVAEALGVTAKTVRKWRTRFDAEGTAGLTSSPRNRRRTAAALRWRVIRPPRPGDAAPDSYGRSVPTGLLAAAVCSSMTHLRGSRPLTRRLIQPCCAGPRPGAARRRRPTTKRSIVSATASRTPLAASRTGAGSQCVTTGALTHSSRPSASQQPSSYGCDTESLEPV